MRIVAALVLTGALVVAGTSGTSSVATAAPAADRPGLELVALDPWVGIDSEVTATVATHDLGAGATVTPTLYDAVATRSAFDLTTQGQNLLAPLRELDPHELEADTDVIEVRFGVTDGTGEPGDESAQDIVLTRPGVYPLVFTARDEDGTPITELVSYLVRLPSHVEGDTGRHPLAVATQLRLQPRPTSDADGELTLTPDAIRAAQDLITGVMGDDPPHDGLRRSIGFAISPAFLDAAMSTGHADLVNELAGITDGNSVQSQPWAPLSLGAWLATPELASEVDRSLEHGDRSLTDLLTQPDAEVSDLVAWGGDISADALAWFVEQGTTAFLVAQDDLDDLDTALFPRTLAAPFLLETGTGDVLAAQLDTALSTHFTNPDPILGANHLIADLSVIATDLPSVQRGMVVAPPPDWSPSAELLRAYIESLDAATPRGSDALLVHESPKTVITETPQVRANGDTFFDGPPLLRRLRSENSGSVPPTLARGVQRSSELIDSLATMQPGGTEESETTIRQLRDQISLAAMPGESAAERKTQFDAIQADVTSTASAIDLADHQTITLTSSDAVLPISIRREPDGPTRVTVHIDAPDRLTFPDGRSRTVDLDDAVTRLDLRVHADSPGDTLVRLTVTSPDQRLVAGTTDLMVRSTAASGVGLVISFGSLAFLILWWGRDIFRSRRGRRERHIPPAELIDID